MTLNSLYQSFFIRAGRETTFVKRLNLDHWAQFNSNYHLLEGENPIVYINSGNIKNINRPQKTPSENCIELNAFKHPRLIVAEFFILEQYLQSVLKCFPKKWWESRKTFIFQLDYEPEQGFTSIEMRAVRDALEHSGAKEVIIISSTATEHEINSFINHINQFGVSKKSLADPKWRKLFY